MPIPDFRTIMPVMLEHLADLQEHSDREVTETMADHFGLSMEERTRYLPGSDRKVFVDRVAWAKAELGMAGLIAIPRRGEAVITERGLDVLQQGQASLEREFFQRFPENSTKMDMDSLERAAGFTVGGVEQYPREVMEGAYERLRRDLASEVLSRLHAASPGLFRRLIIDLLMAMGYGGTLRDAVRAIGNTADKGVEGTIRVDRLGVDSVHVQAKRSEEPLGRKDIEAFDRAVRGKGVWRGIFMTTSSFSREAVWSATSLERPIALVNGDDLAGLMIDYDIGVSTIAVYTIKDIDAEAFRER